MSGATEVAKRDALGRLAALERTEAALYAEKALALVAVAELWSGRDDPARPFLELDVALACQVAQSTASARMRTARHLVEHLPSTLHLLQTEQLTIGQAIVLVKETEGLSPTVCHRVETAVLPRIGGMTPGDTRREVKRAIVALDQLLAEQRRALQREQRRVWTSPRPDGRAFVGAEQSAEDAGTFWRALTELSVASFEATDPRTRDQQRADVFRHLPAFALEHLSADPDRPGPGWQEFLRTRHEDGIAPAGCSGSTRRRRHRRVQAVILVPVETALDLSDHPAELLGYGPISGAHARELLAIAALRKACTDRYTGRIIALGQPDPPPPPPGGPPADLEGQLLHLVLTPTPLRTDPEPQHDPSSYLSDLARLRDSRCTGPGCAAPAHTCDLEHAVAYPTGSTSADNVAPVSRRCHNAKTHGGWTLTPHPDGSITWTSPLGASWTQPPRHHPSDETALRFPRVVRPFMRIELDLAPHRRAS